MSDSTATVAKLVATVDEFVPRVAYRFGAVYVKFIGTHREYDRIDADTVEKT